MSAALTTQTTPRVQRLFEQAQSLADDIDVCERTLLVTESYRRTEGQPAVLRRARALAHVLEHQTIRFESGAFFAGGQFRTVSVHRGVADEWKWAAAIQFPEGHGIRLDPAPQDVQKRLADAAGYWRGQPGLWAARDELLSEQTRRAMRCGVFDAGGFFVGHQIPDFPTVLRQGILPLLEAVRARGQRAAAEREPFLDAVEIALRAAAAYAERHAQEARRQAQEATDPDERRWLLEMAEVCGRVPAQPARTLREALQVVWFIHRIAEIEQGGPGPTANSLGRLDQYLLPYLEGDLSEGRLTQEQAQELIDAFFVKLYRVYDDQNTVIGGLRPDGEDGTNALSWMCLEAMARVPYSRAVTVRVSRKTPDSFLRRATEILKLGLGRPDFQNDEVNIPALAAKGISLEDARDYAVVGCVELVIPGRSDSRPMSQAFNLLKVLELTLNEGRCQCLVGAASRGARPTASRDQTSLLQGREQRGSLSGERLADGVPATFDSYQALHGEYRRLARHFIGLAVEANLAAERVQPNILPHPFLSALTRDCIEKGCELTAGGARYNLMGVNLFGVADVANALHALREAVFERKWVTLPQLRQALAADFQGHEALRQRLKTRLPKFGNDQAAVDLLAAEEAAFYAREVGGCTNWRGGPFAALLFGTTTEGVWHLASQTAASPDGRRAGDPLSLSANAAVGTNRSGPSALANSVARLPAVEYAGGFSFTPDLEPSLVRGEQGTEAFCDLLRAYFAQGGAEMGPSVLDEKTLRAAQRDPERYGGLCVRLFGYSARFVQLSPQLQEHIIARVGKGI